MISLGRINTLEVVRETENGVYLDGGNFGEILMPRKFVTNEIMDLGRAEVFVYADSDDRLVATTEQPYAKAGEFAYLEVAEVTKFGAFLDWGLPKQLLVPFSEQRSKMIEGKKYLVYIYTDMKTNRIAASAKVDKFISETLPDYELSDKVELVVAEETDLGYKVIVDNQYWGMLYKNQLFLPLSIGENSIGYVNKIREDGKIDLLPEPRGYDKIEDMAANLLKVLKDNNGFVALSDKSSPEMIQALLGISKKNFKKAVGYLYKKRLVDFQSDGIKLIS